MNENNAKCPHCGAELFVGLKKGTALCLACKKQFDAEKGIKLYESIHPPIKESAEEKKVAHGSDYLEVERILDRVEFYLNKRQFQEAEEELKEALTLTNSDYRVYFGFVRAETKNFTDYRNVTHKPYLEKAIECADSDEKATITRLYKDFYRLSECTDEEIEQYRTEENAAIKKKTEERFKNIIPTYMNIESVLKKKPWIFGALYALAAVGVVLGFVISGGDYMFALAAVFFIVGFVFTKNYLDERRAIALFNAALDVYDAMDGFNLDTVDYREMLDALKEVYAAFKDKNGYTAQEKSLSALCSVGVNSSSFAKAFFEKHAVLGSMCPSNEED